MKTKDLLHSICACRIRFFQSGWRAWTVKTGTAGQADDVCRAILDTGKVSSGIEGWERLSKLGLVQHVFTLCFNRAMIRIVSPAISAGGCFSAGLKEAP
jgi:hypothetical protein